MNPIFEAKVAGGTIIFSNHERVEDYLLLLNGKYIQVILNPSKPKSGRSNNQNRYYWGVSIKLVSDFLGYTENETHEVLKALFLTREVRIKNKKIDTFKTVNITRSTTELNTAEFEEFLTKIREWASIELGVYIPTPNEVDYA